MKGKPSAPRTASTAFLAMVRQWLSGKGISQSAAERDTGLPKQAIQSLHRGTVPSLDRAAEICTALGLDFQIGPRGCGPFRDVDPIVITGEWRDTDALGATAPDTEASS